MAPRTATKKADRAPEPVPDPEPEPAPSPEVLAAAARFFAPPDVVDEEDDDAVGGGLAFVRSGAIRMTVGDKRYRLRRPTFGQLRTLRLGFQDVEWATEDATDDARAASARMKAEIAAVTSEDPERRQKLAAIKAESRKASREHDAILEGAYIGWWRDVFQSLSEDGTPDEDEMPTWVVDHRLATQVLNHWRQVPLAPGTSGNGHKP